ncbi:MAG TPA: exo-alpha-sialidase [Planctomycetaceae bacterium]|nr:exo-alpha-sialidase [Planctomycetaceae bacterium]HIQ23315.1 exo-alpha-sialidase [Planctomycetota bacterium]
MHSATRAKLTVYLTVVLVALLAAARAGSAAEGVGYAETKTGGRPRPAVAVDNVCAWPNLTVLPGGTIVATIFNQPSHGSVAGDVECWASRDNGRTWQKVGTAAPHEPHTNRMNVAAGLTAGGDLIVIASGWSNRYPPGRTGPAFRAGILHPWLCRSSDGGKTWSIDKTGLPDRAPDGHRWVPFGDILPGDDGVLRAAVYSWPGRHPRNERAWCIQSRDDGKTWGGFTPIDKDNLRNETAIVNLGGGRWLAAARYSALYGYASEDNCRTWRPLGRLTSPGQHPGHLLRLKDGRVLLSYGNRTGTVHGVEVRVSSDEGRSWSAPVRLLDWWGDGGYPSSVQLADGQILTAYYAAKIEGHTRYHMGVVIWDPVRSLGAAE